MAKPVCGEAAASIQAMYRRRKARQELVRRKQAKLVAKQECWTTWLNEAGYSKNPQAHFENDTDENYSSTAPASQFEYSDTDAFSEQFESAMLNDTMTEYSSDEDEASDSEQSDTPPPHPPPRLPLNWRAIWNETYDE